MNAKQDSVKKSTVDQMFILKTMTDKFLFRKRGSFYCMFVDFSKAFDTVNRNYLFYSQIKSEKHGKCEGSLFER